MVKILKITTHFILMLGLIVLSFKPSVSNQVTPSLIHPHHVAFSQFSSLSKRKPVNSHSSELRSSFQKNEDKRRLPVAIASVPLADVFAFNTPRYNPGMSSISLVAASSPLKTVVLRI